MKRLYIAVIVMTASCASHQTIPENWKLPASVGGEKCPDISGHYMNSGEAIDKKSHVYLHSHWFFGEYEKYSVPPGKWMEIRQVLIRQEEANQLEIVAMSDSGTIEGRRILEKENGEFSCQDGWIRITGSIRSGTSGSMGFANHIRSFANTGGYLIEKEEYDSFGLILIIPIAGSGTRWYRFSRVEGRRDKAPNH
jgi:hypothetical protein